jgi:hypothetical protein
MVGVVGVPGFLIVFPEVELLLAVLGSGAIWGA